MHRCLCCRNRTLHEEPPGTFEVCPVCFWEDDLVQGLDSQALGGANQVTLTLARSNYACFGASDEQFIADPVVGATAGGGARV